MNPGLFSWEDRTPAPPTPLLGQAWLRWAEDELQNLGWRAYGNRVEGERIAQMWLEVEYLWRERKHGKKA